MATPRATYRLQLRPGFDFDAAADVADYLARLGVSHLYSSPYLQAAAGSTHGYDVVDPTRVNAELGGEQGHGRLGEALARAGLGQVLDIVPNHMAITGAENRWWWDVLRNGRASAFAPYFDVDWDPPERRLRDHVLMPVLGDHYGRELEGGSIRLTRDDGGFRIRYHDHALPVAPRSLGPLLERAARRLDGDESVRTAGTAGTAEAGAELAFLARSLQALPESGPADAEARRRRRADLAVIDHRLDALLEEERVRAAVAAVMEAVNADADRLDALLRAQNYRLAFWRAAGEELDYRRFFDIDTLAGLRAEDPEVFAATHERVLAWLREGVLDGVRVDHPDGLRRPGEYFRRLREAAPEAWIVAEKILMSEEAPPEWPVDGTTGYDLLNDVTGVFVDPAGEAPLTSLWHEVSGDARAFHDVALEARLDVLRDVLGADVNRLANIFLNLCEERRRYRDFTRPELREALVQVAARFPVYRTYVGETGPEAERGERAGVRDRAVIGRAVEAAKAGETGLDPELLDFLRAILNGEIQDDEARGLRMRFQQLTGPVAAKGEEDTAFYRYHRLVALNEVGGDPGRWGLAPSSFHERMTERARTQPGAMNALSTHDTKRSEDVRARLVLLAEVTEQWSEAVGRWRGWAGEHWSEGVERDPATEYLLFQTLVGAWPIGEDRVAAYMEKATREAKRRTSWTHPDGAYEAALRRLVAAVYASGLMEDVARFAEPLVEPGRVVSLAQKLVQLTAPGVPDIYQGTELWDLSLVDPDNRRPVDFEARRALLDRAEALGTADTGSIADAVLAAAEEGLPKLWVVRQALRARWEHGAAFAGGYRPLTAAGPAATHVLGYARGEAVDGPSGAPAGAGGGGAGGGGEVAVVVPRFPVRLAREGGWRDTTLTLPTGRWRNALTGHMGLGGVVAVAELLDGFPVALLTREDG